MDRIIFACDIDVPYIGVVNSSQVVFMVFIQAWSDQFMHISPFVMCNVPGGRDQCILIKEDNLQSKKNHHFLTGRCCRCSEIIDFLLENGSFYQIRSSTGIAKQLDFLLNSNED